MTSLTSIATELMKLSVSCLVVLVGLGIIVVALIGLDGQPRWRRRRRGDNE